eukprot:1370618-Amphidinium_carterae.2
MGRAVPSLVGRPHSIAPRVQNSIKVEALSLARVISDEKLLNLFYTRVIKRCPRTFTKRNLAVVGDCNWAKLCHGQHSLRHLLVVGRLSPPPTGTGSGALATSP